MNPNTHLSNLVLEALFLDGENLLTSEEEALAYINKYGFVTLFPIKGEEFPSLYSTIKGTREEKLEKVWQWSDNLAQAKRIHYGKLIRKQVTLVSLEYFPFFRRLGHEHPLGEVSKCILEYLQTQGKTSTSNLRKNLGFQTKETKAAFVRAIDNLQIALAIAIVQREPAPRYTYTYDLMERWMPKELIEGAEKLTLDEAQECIIGQLMELSVIAHPQDAKRFVRF